MSRKSTIPVGALLALLLLPVAVAQAEAQLEVREQVWGFGGRVVPERFNPLSLLIVNVSDQPFQGALFLSQDSGVGGRIGARLVEATYLSPRSARWVQFYPFIGDTDEQWTVSWGRGSARRKKLTEPDSGPPACVMLADPDDPVQRTADLKQFSAALFPHCAAATDALDAVVLDHVPQWSPAQSKAFLNWLYRGGTVCVIHEPVGTFPRFAGDLAALNTALPRQHLGAGLVIRHGATRRQLTRETLAELGVWRPEAKADAERDTPFALTSRLLGALKGMTRPKHNWPVLLTLGALYVVLICPANWLLGLWKDYRLTSLAFVVCVAAFSVTFFTLGKRGYGEKATVHSISYARPAAGGVYDLTQWSNVFVTSGAEYTITHDSPYNLYSTGLDFETVPGVIQNGGGGRFVVDMPLFSTRSFVHRGQVKGGPLIARIIDFEAGARLEALTLEAGAGFPDPPRGIWAVYGGRVYALGAARNGQLSLRDRGMELELFAGEAGEYFYGRGYRWGRMSRDDDEAPEVLRRKVLSALARGFIADLAGYRPEEAGYVPRPVPRSPRRRTTDREQDVAAELPATVGSVQLFVVAETPTAFHASGGQLGSEFGYTVYHQPLFPPEGTASD